jgi:hypothetical protein
MKAISLWTDSKPAANKGLAKVAVQWLMEHLCFVFATFAKPRIVFKFILHWIRGIVWKEFLEQFERERDSAGQPLFIQNMDHLQAVSDYKTSARRKKSNP